MSILNLLPTKTAKAKNLILPPGHADSIDRYLAATRILEHAESDQASVKENLTDAVRDAFFKGNAGLAAPMKSIQLVGNQGTVLVSFASQWAPKAEEIPLPPELIREQFTLSIKSDEIPPEKQEPLDRKSVV